MQDPELDPCPFCGKPAAFNKMGTAETGFSWGAHCTNEECPVRPFTHKFYSTMLEAAAVWNHRPTRNAREEAVKTIDFPS